MSVSLLAALSMMSMGCAEKNKFVSLEAAGQAFPRAEYQILGKTRNDQIWISKTIEAEVAGFGFERPKARPASWDAAIAPAKRPAALPARARVLKPSPPSTAPRAPSHGGIALPAPHTNAPAVETIEPAKPAPIPAPAPHKRSTMQRLRDDLDAAKAKIRRLEGR